MSIQQMLLGVGAVAKSTYIDDIFSTYVYEGTGSARSINNGINLSDSGGLVWTKQRNGTGVHKIFDTVRGADESFEAANNNGSWKDDSGTIYLSAFNNNGFSFGSGHANTNASSDTYASWALRKSPGFLDIVEWDGDGNTGRGISHGLGSIPGFIIIKQTDGNQQWMVYHRSQGSGKYGVLSSTAAWVSSNYMDDGTSPTSTTFYLSGHDYVNGSSKSYIAYIFAGGESTAATARSVDFDGSSKYLNIDDTSNGLASGTNDFTLEMWLKPSAWTGDSYLLAIDTTGGLLIRHDATGAGSLAFTRKGGGTIFTVTGYNPPRGKWTHLALVRHSNKAYLYDNGQLIKTSGDISSLSLSSGDTYIGIDQDGNQDEYDGLISNLRFVKGTAVYTSAFKPPTEPLTNITNTTLLCCNNSSITGSTVTPGTITSSGSPTASSDSPFDDPAGFVFGEEGDQNVIKCGSYVGNGSSSAPPEVYLGWEPQWVMVKRTNGSGQDWVMVDSMRGMFVGETNTPHLRANASNAEQDTSYYRIDISSGTGFAPFTTDNGLNGDGDEYIFMACRRSDGYVGKPRTATELFAMDTGAGTTTIPNYDSGFPVDISLRRQFASSDSWVLGSRLMGGKILETNDTDAEQNAGSAWAWDSNVGWGEEADGATYQSWMWRRSNSFTTVAYKADGVAGRKIRHDLSKIPEMIFIKARTQSSARDWQVGHIGINGGTNPWNGFLKLNSNAAQYGADNQAWNSTAPTSTVFTIGDSYAINMDTYEHIALLFSSVDGISKCGFYDGSSSDQAISLGFQPRFLIIKVASGGTGDWMVYDTTRGWPTWAGSKAASGFHKQMQLNTSGGQYLAEQVWPTSTGFHLLGGENSTNNASRKYIYYAHA